MNILSTACLKVFHDVDKAAKQVAKFGVKTEYPTQRKSVRFYKRMSRTRMLHASTVSYENA